MNSSEILGRLYDESLGDYQEFACDKCVRTCGFRHPCQPDDGWLFDLEKYIVLCPDCSGWEKRRWPKTLTSPPRGPKP